MASLRMGACLVLVFVAVAFLAAPALALGEDVVTPYTASNAAEWDEYIATVAQQDEVRANEEATLAAMGVLGTQAVPKKGRTIVVDKSGKGDFKTVQKAIDSVREGNTKRITIVINKGVYREKILIPKTKPWIKFECKGTKTILVWGDTAEKAGGTSLSASTAVESEGFIATDCTFANSAPAPPGGAVGKQAVALRIQGDKAAFYRCKFFGAQDTLYDKEGRHYYRNCHIQGSIDYIFGHAQTIYHYCKIVSIARANSGSITAHKRESNDKSGFVFLNCRISGSGTIYLGRAWGTHSRVVFIKCYMANMILPIGWQDWNDPKRQKTVFYAEHACSGPGANRKGRAKWSKVLNSKQAAPFANFRFIGASSWLGKFH